MYKTCTHLYYYFSHICILGHFYRNIFLLTMHIIHIQFHKKILSKNGIRIKTKKMQFHILYG